MHHYVNNYILLNLIIIYFLVQIQIFLLVIFLTMHYNLYDLINIQILYDLIMHLLFLIV